MDETVYYKSPVGILRIRTDGDSIAELHFLHKDLSEEAAAPGPEIVDPKTELLRNCFQQLDQYFSGKLFIFDLPLRPHGTDFQQKVWNGLLQIAYGRTETYQSLSKRVAGVKAIRAVGTANGRNNISIIIPCHRVIGSNGTLVGYGGGIWRKQWLLEHEAKYANGVQTLF